MINSKESPFDLSLNCDNYIKTDFFLNFGFSGEHSDLPGGCDSSRTEKKAEDRPF